MLSVILYPICFCEEEETISVRSQHAVEKTKWILPHEEFDFSEGMAICVRHNENENYRFLQWTTVNKNYFY